jgi:hypothetical protein
MNFELNQIFEGDYPPEAAVWCNENNAYITELEQQDKVRRFQIVGIPEPTLDEVRTTALSRVDAATSSAILAGFDYEIDAGGGAEVLHFSYDSFDQQNFSDTFNGVAMKKLMGVEELPETIEWNGWRGHNAESKGELVRLTLDVPTFLALYTGGALVHKAVQMEIGGRRKEAINAAETVEAVEALLTEWGI